MKKSVIVLNAAELLDALTEAKSSGVELSKLDGDYFMDVGGGFTLISDDKTLEITYYIDPDTDWLRRQRERSMVCSVNGDNT